MSRARARAVVHEVARNAGSSAASSAASHAGRKAASKTTSRAARKVARTAPQTRPRHRASQSVVHSFPPLVDAHSRVLILGSMPGIASLRAQQYYAHPQNLFWRMLGALVELDATAPYAERTRALLTARLALWDVLKSCTRTSSLDSDIDDDTLVLNDIAGLLRAHPHVRTVVCNGGKAAQVFARHIAPTLPPSLSLDVHAVPSTSPANASISWEKKLAAWRRALADVR